MAAQVQLDDIDRGDWIVVHTRDIGMDGPIRRHYFGRYNGLSRTRSGRWVIGLHVHFGDVWIGALKVTGIERQRTLRMDLK